MSTVTENNLKTVVKEKKYRSKKTNARIMNTVIYVVLSIGAIAMVYPLIWMIFASLKYNTADVYKTILFPLPGRWKIANYVELWKELNDPTYFAALLNTTLYSTLPVIIGSLVSALAAFGYAKINFKFKNILFLLLLGSIMIPFPTIMVHQFLLYSNMNWLNSPLTQIIPKFFGSVMMIFFLRQYLIGMPDSLVEAAKIDGASYPRIFWSIVLPVLFPALFAQALLWFMGSWNDYLGPLLFVRNRDWFPLTLALAKFNGSNTLHANVPVIMAGSLLSILPVLVLFGVFQKAIINSVMMSGMKD